MYYCNITERVVHTLKKKKPQKLEFTDNIHRLSLVLIYCILNLNTESQKSNITKLRREIQSALDQKWKLNTQSKIQLRNIFLYYISSLGF